MPTFTHTLEPLSLPSNIRILQPPRAPLQHVTADSPALEVMTDLAKVRLITITSEVSVDTALAAMIHAKVRLLLVTGEQGVITGLVSAQDLMGEKPLRIASDERIRHEDVQVAQVMSRVENIRPLELREVEHAAVRDIVRHLIDDNKQHALVVSATDDLARYTACGIFSLTQISRQLGETISLSESPAQSFAEFERLIG